MKIRNIVGILIIGGVGGFFVGNLILPFLIRNGVVSSNGFLAKLSTPFTTPTPVGELSITTSPTVTPTPIISTGPEYFSEAVNSIKDSVIAIQSFDGEKLVSSGNGIVLTQDGLIGTIKSIVPSAAKVIQIISEGKIYKAAIVYRNPTSDLAIISFSGDNSRVVRLKNEIPGLNSELMVFSKSVVFSKDESNIIETLVSQSDNVNNKFAIKLEYDSKINGSPLIDNEGLIVGMINLKNKKVEIIPSVQISNTLSTYLSKK